MNDLTHIHRLAILLALPLAVWVVAASNAAVSPAQPHGAYDAASVMTLMVEKIAPAAASIWNRSYAEKISDAEWTELRAAAAILRQTEQTVTAGGTLPADRARAGTPLWAEWAQKYADQTAGLQRAADARDQKALAEAGDAMLEACGGCHMAFPANLPL